MSDLPSPLSPEELQELRKLLKAIDGRTNVVKSILTAHSALTWLYGAAKNLAMWVAAVIGAIVAYKNFMGK